MKSAILSKDNFAEWLSALASNARILAPVVSPEGVELSELQPGSEILFDYVNFKLPVKRQVLPQREIVATRDGGDGELRDVAPPDAGTVLFGVRSCDARSLVLLDKVFLETEPVDPYYRGRRQNTTVIGLACNRPGPGCFCTSVGGHPAGDEGVDLLVTDLDDVLFLKAITEKGEALLRDDGVLETPAESHVAACEKAATAAAERMPLVDLDAISAKLRAAFDSPEWEKRALPCIGCGSCTFMCPTCHCFGLYEEKRRGGSDRVRAQDTCAFATFTVEASGHNPRPARGSRTRQRLLHKFCYALENHGNVFCVGCGRCVTGCPANSDIREILAEARQ